MNAKKVAVAMSGGLDSSVTAALLLKKGYEVVGMTMDIGLEETKRETVEKSQKIADKLGIPFYSVDYKKEFKNKVINYFRQEYSLGRTPNPCIVCNEKIKFGLLREEALSLGIEFIATGHYAKIEYDKRRNRHLLRKGIDKRKDQSYVLFRLTQNQLKHTLMPLGNYTKRKVKEIAEELDLNIDGNLESQDVCFMAQESHHKFLKTKTGPILNKKGKVLGEHQGIHFFTVGQRKGLGISQGNPLYVIDIDKEKNALIVGEEKDIFKDKIMVGEVNWIAIEKLNKPCKVKAKIRYAHCSAEALITALSHKEVQVEFSLLQRAITPGQAVVFYHNDIVLGGGWIKN